MTGRRQPRSRITSSVRIAACGLMVGFAGWWTSPAGAVGGHHSIPGFPYHLSYGSPGLPPPFSYGNPGFPPPVWRHFLALAMAYQQMEADKKPPFVVWLAMNGVTDAETLHLMAMLYSMYFAER